jgi:hypothetical protein
MGSVSPVTRIVASLENSAERRRVALPASTTGFDLVLAVIASPARYLRARCCDNVRRNDAKSMPERKTIHFPAAYLMIARFKAITGCLRPEMK